MPETLLSKRRVGRGTKPAPFFLVPKLRLGMPSRNAPRCDKVERQSQWVQSIRIDRLFDAERRGRHSQTEFGNEQKNGGFPLRSYPPYIL